ncbi:MAG: ComEC/Rec2 family competence protein [Ruminococcus sp.]|nr:ComEC/Rec2 family competence protein [Ruminococcus sp.]
MIRKTCCALLPFQAGLLAAFFMGGTAWVAVFPVMGIAMLIFGFCRSIRYYTAVISLSFCAGLAASCAYTALTYEKIIAFDGQSVSVKGYVYDMKEYDSGSCRIIVRGSIDGGQSTSVGFYIDKGDYDRLTYGDDVTVCGVVYKITDSISYQSERSSKANGVFLRGGKAERIIIGGSNSHPIFRFARQLRDKARNALADKGGEGGKYLGAMICGDRSGVDDNISEEMYRAGIGHIFAFSGTHIVIMISAVSVILEAISKRRLLNVSLLLFVTWGLVLFSGLSVSAIRAAIMMSVLLISTLAKQKSDPLTALAIAGFMISAISPYCVASNSFILSFSGSFACSFYADALGERLHKDKTYPPTGFKRTLITVFCAGLLLMPINGLLFGRVSVISPITNLLMIPVCSLCMIVALLGLLLSFIPVISGAFIWYASLMLRGCMVFTGALSRLPFASICTYHIAAKAAMVMISALPIIIMILPCKKYILFIMYSFSAAVMIGVSMIVSYTERDRLHLIIYSCKDSEALIAYDTEGTVFASYDGGRLCFEAFEKCFLTRGLSELDGVVCAGSIPDMPLMTDSGTSYSSEHYESPALGRTQIRKDSITYTFDNESVVIEDKKVYNSIDGYVYDLSDGAIEIILDKGSSGCTVRRLDNGFDNTL